MIIITTVTTIPANARLVKRLARHGKRLTNIIIKPINILQNVANIMVTMDIDK